MSNVSRSVFQKVVEENKQLKKDIRILVDYGVIMSERLKVVYKWREIFRKETEFGRILHEAAKKYFEEHKDEFPDFLTKKQS